MVDIRPDPKRPRGGFAVVMLDGVAPRDGDVTVAVFNSYQQKWLGPDGWQANRQEIPARAAEWQGDTLRLVVGPDIVNQIEEDTPIRIDVLGQSFDTYWPDDINHGPDEAIIGDLGGTGAAAAPKKPTTVTMPIPVEEPPTRPEDEIGAEDDTPLTETVEEPVDEDLDEDEFDEEEPPKRSLLPVIFGALVVVAGLAGAAYYFLVLAADEDPILDTPVVQDPPAPAPVVTAAPCGLDALSAQLDQGFSGVVTQIAECGGEVSPDTALTLIERAAAQGDADALALFGAIYDETVTDETIEGAIGVTFSDNPATAADYYARAKAAGSSVADERLNALCLRLRLKTDTLSQGAFEDHCQGQ